MVTKPPEFQTFCKNDGEEKCNMHFLIENEVLSNRDRMEKLEERTRQSLSDLQKTLSDFVIEVRSYIAVQVHRDNDNHETKILVNKNTSDIYDMKSAIKTITDNTTHMSDAVVNMGGTIKTLSETIQNIDKNSLSKKDVEEIAKNAIVLDKSVKQEKWFDSLPAKISAGIAIVSFVAFFTVKIVLLLMGAGGAP